MWKTITEDNPSVAIQLVSFSDSCSVTTVFTTSVLIPHLDIFSCWLTSLDMFRFTNVTMGVVYSLSTRHSQRAVLICSSQLITISAVSLVVTLHSTQWVWLFFFTLSAFAYPVNLISDVLRIFLYLSPLSYLYLIFIFQFMFHSCTVLQGDPRYCTSGLVWIYFRT